VVVYYVLALNLFFGEAYEEVMRQLVNELRFWGTGAMTGRCLHERSVAGPYAAG
jgi:hypothetical protein